MSFSSTLQSSAPAPLTVVKQERGTLETIELALKVGTAAITFGAWAAIVGGTVYLAYRGLKKLRIV